MLHAVVPRGADQPLPGTERGLCQRCALVVDAPVGRPEPLLLCEPCAADVRPSQLPDDPRAAGWWWVDDALEHEGVGDGTVLVARGHRLSRYAMTPAGLLRLGDWTSSGR